MNYAELLGFSPAFGLDKPVVEDAPSSERGPTVPDDPMKGGLTFTQDQLRLLAALGQQGQQNQQRAPAAPAPRVPQMMPMTQLTLPQAPTAPRPGLSQLIYGR